MSRPTLPFSHGLLFLEVGATFEREASGDTFSLSKDLARALESYRGP